MGGKVGTSERAEILWSFTLPEPRYAWADRDQAIERQKG